MSDIAIRVEKLSKQYVIGSKQERYKTLRDTVSDTLSAPLRRISAVLRGRASTTHTDTIWALRDVSFEIKTGEVVGIIGRNGAGKSTLLKILSRITEPTAGYADIYGRVGSLLEVGTGFHPELTGRENIYLNGAILGMKRNEIERKFDEIVAFAEVEKFIDTEVKHYSSGMYLRLAFSVAAHLEPEILLVDEVLAVGDMAFQEKCLGKMEDVSKQGRTVMFVSHNMAAVTHLCTNAFLLHGGTVTASGEVAQVVAHYVQAVRFSAGYSLEERVDRSGSGTTRFSRVQFRNSRQECTDVALSGDDLYIDFFYTSQPGVSHLRSVSVSAVLSNHLGSNVACLWNDVVGISLKNLEANGRITCKVPHLPMVPGRYSVSLALVVEGRTVDKISDAATFSVAEGNFYGTGKLPLPHLGNVLLPYEWSAGA